VSCLVDSKKCVAATINIGPAKTNRPPGNVCGLGLRDAVRVGEYELANGRTLLLAIAVETIATPVPRKTNPEDVKGAASPVKRGTTTHKTAVHSKVVTITDRL